MRPPYGDIDDRVRAIALQMGLTPIIWTSVNGTSFDTFDWEIAGGVVNADTVSLYPLLPNNKMSTRLTYWPLRILGCRKIPKYHRQCNQPRHWIYRTRAWFISTINLTGNRLCFTIRACKTRFSTWTNLSMPRTTIIGCLYWDII